MFVQNITFTPVQVVWGHVCAQAIEKAIVVRSKRSSGPLILRPNWNTFCVHLSRVYLLFSVITEQQQPDQLGVLCSFEINVV